MYFFFITMFHYHFITIENTSINELKRFLTLNSLYIPPVNNFTCFVLSIGYTPIGLCFFMLKRNITSDFRYKLLGRNVELWFKWKMIIHWQSFIRCHPLPIFQFFSCWHAFIIHGVILFYQLYDVCNWWVWWNVWFSKRQYWNNIISI